MREELNRFKNPQGLAQLPELTNLKWKEWKEQEIIVSINKNKTYSQKRRIFPTFCRINIKKQKNWGRFIFFAPWWRFDKVNIAS